MGPVTLQPMFSYVKPSPNSDLRGCTLRIFDDDVDFSSPTSPSAAYLWRVGRHLAQNWSKTMKNDDSQTHVLHTQGMSRSHHGHSRKSPDVYECTWHVHEIFQKFVKLILFTQFHMHHIVILFFILCAPCGAKHSPPGASK